MKVLMLGNCQSLPLAATWSAMRPNDEVASYEIHTLIGDVWAQDAALRRLELADVVLHHPISAEYPVPFARGNVLAARSGAQKLRVPMIFFGGLQPDIVYVGGPGDRVHSPMGDYHSKIVLTQFLAGRSEREALACMDSEDTYAEFGYFEEFDRSAAELRRRDHACDIAGAPILLDRVIDQPTLFTVNHPMNVIFVEIVLSAFRLLGLQYQAVAHEYISPTLAGGPVWPPGRAVHAHHGLKFPASAFLKTDFGGQRLLSFETFVGESYDIYKANRTKLLATTTAKNILEALGARGSDAGTPSERSAALQPPLARRRSKEQCMQDAANALPENPPLALTLSQDAIWLAPDDSDTRLRVAQVLKNLDRAELAVKLLNPVVSNPRVEMAKKLACIELLIECGRTETVKDELRAFPIDRSTDMGLLEFLAPLARKLGEHHTAIRACLRLIDLSPRKGPAYAFLAHVLMDVRQPHYAIACIDKGIAEDPRNAHHFCLRGYAFENLGRRNSALDDYSLAFAIEPENAAFRGAVERVKEAMRTT